MRCRHSQSTNARNEISSTTSTERVAVIEPHELGQLSPSEVVCLCRGASAKGFAPPTILTSRNSAGNEP